MWCGGPVAVNWSSSVERTNRSRSAGSGSGWVVWKPDFGAETGYVAPEGPVETALAEIWADVLGLPRVGTRDSFFKLGGDSILSIQVVAKARQAGLRVATKDVFLHQTIAAMAPLVTM